MQIKVKMTCKKKRRKKMGEGGALSAERNTLNLFLDIYVYVKSFVCFLSEQDFTCSLCLDILAMYIFFVSFMNA